MVHAGHQERESGGVAATENFLKGTAQMMNTSFQLTYHWPEISFMVIFNWKVSEKWKYILSWGWPCLQLKIESVIAIRNKQIMGQGEGNQQSLPENPLQCVS